jgi:hypothetical protein
MIQFPPTCPDCGADGVHLSSSPPLYVAAHYACGCTLEVVQVMRGAWVDANAGPCRLRHGILQDRLWPED